MREQFFSTTGLTSTSAAHVANMAKEFIQSLESGLDRLQFYSDVTTVAGNEYQTKKATDKLFFQNEMCQIIAKVAMATQLISWLREALKEKKDAITNILSFDKWCKMKGIELEYPQLKSYLTKEEVIKDWDVNKLNAYLQAQTFAAVYGKHVHPDGCFAKARKDYFNKCTNPIDVTDSGRDLTVVEHKFDYSVEEIDAKFFELQNSQREYQAKFNQYEHEIQTALDLNKSEIDALHAKESRIYSEQYSAYLAEYNSWYNTENKRIADLKIAIPDNLNEIFKEISGLGK